MSLLKSKTLLRYFKCFNKFRAMSRLSFDPTAEPTYLFGYESLEAIEDNIKKRKGIGNIQLVNQLQKELSSLDPNSDQFRNIERKLYRECLLIPNKTHPNVYNIEDPKLVSMYGTKEEAKESRKHFHEIAKKLNLIRTEQLGNLAGSKSYFLLGDLARLERALIKYCVNELLKRNFELISVPDLLPRELIEKCGMNTHGDRTQVYTLDPELHESDLCLSGTSEISLSGYLANTTLNFEDLPKKLCAVSRCYRAEVSSMAEEKGIYRVHEFTKVEMFVVSHPNESDSCLEDLKEYQENLFKPLGLHFQVLDMPPHELGAPAYRKYDIEAWMPGRKIYGEISSCSNCTDFQSRKLNITFKDRNGNIGYAHTLNGTACAIPRLLIALVETGHNSDTVSIPEVLQKFIGGKTFLERQKQIPELKLIKNKKVS